MGEAAGAVQAVVGGRLSGRRLQADGVGQAGQAGVVELEAPPVGAGVEAHFDGDAVGAQARRDHRMRGRDARRVPITRSGE